MARDFTVLDELEDHSVSIITDHGVDAGVAEKIGYAIKTFFRDHWGGSNIYFTKSSVQEVNKRDQAIFDRWDGTNMDELRNDYGLSVQMIYRIISRVRDSQKATGE